MKKKIRILAILTFACLVSSCGHSSDGSSTPPSSTPPDIGSSVTPPSSSVDETIHVTSLNIDKDSVTLNEGETETISVEVLPLNATDPSYDFAVGDPTIASISKEGEILGIKEGTTSITASSHDGNHSDVVMVHVFHTYSITTNPPAGVEVSVQEKAREGDLVYVDLQYDDSALVIHHVYANAIELGTAAGRYYFYMPNADVEITVDVAPVIQRYQVINTQKNAVHLETSGAYAAGEEVEIPFTLLPGYQFAGTVRVLKNIGAFDPADKIEVDSHVTNGVIYFTMPNENVEITVAVETSLFTITKVDTFSHISSIKADDTTVYATDGVYDVKYGQTVKVTFVSESSSACTKALPTGIYIPEMDLTVPMQSGAASFVMPYYHVSVQVLTEAVYRNITLMASDHLALSLYHKIDGEYVLITDNRAVYEDRVYIKVTSTDPSLYQIRSLKGKYTEEDRSYTSNLVLTLETDGYYSFSMPKVEFNTTLDITVTEKDMSLFSDATFVGSYLGIELYGSRNNLTAFNDNFRATIDTSGSMSLGTSTIKEIIITSFDETSGQLSVLNQDETRGVAYFKDHLIASNWNFGNTTSVTSDMVFLIQKQDANDDDSLYSIHAVFMKEKYFFGQVYRDGVLYQTFVADANTQTIISNPTFTFTSGTWVTDSNAVYDVSMNQVNRYHVENGSVITYDGLQGTYTNDENATLVLDGLGNATYASNAYTYSVQEDGTLVLQRLLESSFEIISISLSENAFTITSISNEDFAPIYQHNFYGKTSYSYYIHFAFDRPDACVVYVLYEPSTTSIPTSAGYGYDGNATYSYDAATSTLTVKTTAGSAVFTLGGEPGSYTLTCVESTIKFYGGALNANTILNEFVIE